MVELFQDNFILQGVLHPLTNATHLSYTNHRGNAYMHNNPEPWGVIPYTAEVKAMRFGYAFTSVFDHTKDLPYRRRKESEPVPDEKRLCGDSDEKIYLNTYHNVYKWNYAKIRWTFFLRDIDIHQEKVYFGDNVLSLSTKVNNYIRGDGIENKSYINARESLMYDLLFGDADESVIDNILTMLNDGVSVFGDNIDLNTKILSNAVNNSRDNPSDSVLNAIQTAADNVAATANGVADYYGNITNYALKNNVSLSDSTLSAISSVQNNFRSMAVEVKTNGLKWVQIDSDNPLRGLFVSYINTDSTTTSIEGDGLGNQTEGFNWGIRDVLPRVFYNPGMERLYSEDPESQCPQMRVYYGDHKKNSVPLPEQILLPPGRDYFEEGGCKRRSELVTLKFLLEDIPDYDFLWDTDHPLYSKYKKYGDMKFRAYKYYGCDDDAGTDEGWTLLYCNIQPVEISDLNIGIQAHIYHVPKDSNTGGPPADQSPEVDFFKMVDILKIDGEMQRYYYPGLWDEFRINKPVTDEDGQSGEEEWVVRDFYGSLEVLNRLDIHYEDWEQATSTIWYWMPDTNITRVKKVPGSPKGHIFGPSVEGKCMVTFENIYGPNTDPKDDPIDITEDCTFAIQMIKRRKEVELPTYRALTNEEISVVAYANMKDVCRDVDSEEIIKAQTDPGLNFCNVFEFSIEQSLNRVVNDIKEQNLVFHYLTKKPYSYDNFTDWYFGDSVKNDQWLNQQSSTSESSSSTFSSSSSSSSTSESSSSTFSSSSSSS
ncbi:MAG: hypothetical protein ACOC80_07870, partial [Petrotogales bacterium]